MFGFNKKVEVDGLTYILKGENAIVTKSEKLTLTEIAIPEKITVKGKTYYVSAIDKNAFITIQQAHEINGEGWTYGYHD